MNGFLSSVFGGQEKKGCEIAPKEAPPGMKLATVAGEFPKLSTALVLGIGWSR